MGCWNEIDPITDTFIFENEQVVMVLLTPCAISRNISVGDESYIFQPRYLKEIHKGTYNGYGWVKELPSRNNDDHMRTFFIRQSTWDFICERFPSTEMITTDPNRWEGEVPNFLDEYWSVCGFASNCGIKLTTRLKGAQANYRYNWQFYLARKSLVDQAWEGITSIFEKNGGNINA